MKLKTKLSKLRHDGHITDAEYAIITNVLNKFSTQPCEEKVLKFYYVESLDDYWIGKRLDTMYYAEWDFKLQAFVWTYSKYLPWGEHVVEPNTLWKEYTYPSEPKEISFNEWIKGFLKKHGREQQPYEDCISRQELLEELGEEPFNWNDSPEAIQEVRDYQWFRSLVENAPLVTTKQKTGKWKLLGCYRNGHGRVYNCSECGETEFYVSNYCPNCGARMEVEE